MSYRRLCLATDCRSGVSLWVSGVHDKTAEEQNRSTNTQAGPHCTHAPHVLFLQSFVFASFLKEDH